MGKVTISGGRVDMKKPDSLPSGYTKLEYIESTGTQYINTQFKPNQNTRVVMDAQMIGTVTSGVNPAYFACCNPPTYFRCIKGSSAMTLNWEYGTTYNLGWAMGSTGFNRRRIIDANGRSCTIDGTTQSYSAQTFQINYPIYLLADNTAGTTSYFASARLYSCQIYDNGTLIRDFVPCADTSGNIGVYDLVNKQFYTNAGSGAFIGSEV